MFVSDNTGSHPAVELPFNVGMSRTPILGGVPMSATANTILSVPFLLILAGTAAGQDRSPSVPDWRHGLDEIVKDIRLLHPDPFAKTGKLTFLREAKALKAALPSLTHEQRVVRAMRLVASLGDGHTHLEPDSPAFARWYPVRLYEFTDGFFVTSAHRSVAELAGAQVLEIGSRSVDRVVAEVRKLLGADNAFGSKERLYAVHNAGLMKGLGYAGANSNLKVKFKLRDGKVVVRDLPATKADHPGFKGNESGFEWQFRTEMFGLPFGRDADWLSAYKNLPSSEFQTEDRSRPPHLTCRRPYVALPLPKQDAYYVQVNMVDDGPFVTFWKKVMREVDKTKPRRLILDWRYNFGGDGSRVSAMIQEFVKRADDKPWKELYLLTGRKTFSAAIMALDAFLKHTTFTTVGEPTGSALNHFGDGTYRNFPRTGLRLTVSTRRWQLSESDDLSEFLPVDVAAPFSFSDYAAGRDPAVDAILHGEEMRSLPVIALADGGAAVRKVYEKRKAQFAKYRWWGPPREIDLRHVFQTLRTQKRVADALETCKLSADLHPYNWHAWLNLSMAQNDAGLIAGRLQSLRRVLELDPNNWNRDAIEPLLANGLKPGVIRYGESVASMKAALAGICKITGTRRIDPPTLPNVKEKQMQIDCTGFAFLGKPRRAEFVFRDGSLEMVWIKSGADEQASILKKMTEANGAPTHRNKKYVAFANSRVAVRLDRPEVLFYSEKIAPQVQSWFAR
jgi:hypothetical protein